MPVDLLSFVREQHMAAGGDENHNRVEDILRSWLIKNTDAKERDVKAIWSSLSAPSLRTI